MSNTTCSFDGCENKHSSKGFCDKHYRRWKKSGDPAVTLRKPRGHCTVEGCGNLNNARGMCPTHYQSWLRENGGRISEHELCAVHGCEKNRTHALHCRTHYNFAKKYGDPLYEPPVPTSKKCNGCNERLPLEAFDRRKNRGEMSFLSRCKPCMRKKNLEKQQADREAYNAYQRKWASENRDKRSAIESAQKARRRGVATQRVSRIDIFERDGWICQMCFEPVDKAIKFPHPMSATWDHIIPVSKGGAHSPENLRLAHWHENKAKGAKLAS